MLLTLMLLAAQDPETAVDAERAFNRAAQTDGQWTAFRRFMTDDAVLFTPQPVNAKEALPEKDPPIAVQWWPAESYVSCDGTTAVNTGPWSRPRASGYFTTVWVRQPDGHFKWIYDGGDVLAAPRALPEKPKVRTASCAGRPRSPLFMVYSDAKPGRGESPDKTLIARWLVMPDGSRTFTVQLWTGKRYETVMHDEIAAPK
ncbi:MAG: hypothetical protein V4574_18355 [Pseudomonadota bacterium]